MSIKVTVVGSINVDLVTQVARFPHPGETIIGGDLETIAGGKGANQAVAAARLGAEVTMIGRVGDDAFASRLKGNLKTEGVDVTHVSTTPNTTSGVALILVDQGGQNIIVVASGANAKVTPQDVDGAAEAIASADVLLLQLEIPLESVHRAAQIARAQNVKVILNPAPAQPLTADLLSHINFLIPNESEANHLIDALVNSNGELEATRPEEMLASAAQLRTIGVDTVILTAGEQGVYLAEAKGNRHFPAFSPEQVVDTTAAGDAFVGGLATAIAEGKALSEAILWGNAAGMLAVTRAGAQPSLPSREELEALLQTAAAEQRQGVRM
jgi:ribokinase